MDTDRLKAVAGKYGKVSKKGLYSGAAVGRLTGGYIGMKAGEKVLPEADIVEISPHLDPGTLGPEETAVYTAVVGGYFLGGLSLAKGVTKYQEMKESDVQYTRPFLKPPEGLRKVRGFLEGKEEDEDLREAFEVVFDDEREK
ncbi:hypothetical protein AQV86_03705 [Nanohaloarchaea archaeon SG9]|nr:hypothetical protein AQV86_03705 [Nanohaloarchaea archaeon SG9]